MRTPGAIMAVGSLLLLTAPAAYAETVRPGEEATFALGMLPASTPDVLKQAATAPYIAPAGSDCEGASREIAALDAVLGPDADAPKKGGADAGRVVGQAVKSLIPYRSVVRIVTGADRKQRERDEAAMAGWARRGYLKGLQAGQGCPGGAAPIMAAAQRTPDLGPARMSAPAPAPLAQAVPATAESQPPVRLGRVGRTEPAIVETAFSR
jgi:hypothetical protein